MSTRINAEQDPIEYRLLNPVTDRDRVLTTYCEILDKCPHSFFQSERWIATWLDTLPDSLAPCLVAAIRGNTVVAAAFLHQQLVVRHKVFRSMQRILSGTGDEEHDSLQSEYNTVLVAPDSGIDILDVLMVAEMGQWDELVLPAITIDTLHAISASARPGELGMQLRTDLVSEAHYIDLKSVRDAPNGYIGMLSSSKRQQIRRSIREYEKGGKIGMEFASSAAEAIVMLDELAILHQAEWSRRNQSGAFSSTFFRKFHEDLINRCFSTGEIQLAHIFTPTETVGYVYNFVYDNIVYFYQSGFVYRKKNVFRPGLVSHYLLICHNAERGYHKYDFLAGASQYKRSLATESTPLTWARLQKGYLRFSIENKLKLLKSKMHSVLGHQDRGHRA